MTVLRKSLVLLPRDGEVCVTDWSQEIIMSSGSTGVSQETCPILPEWGRGNTGKPP